MEKNLKEPFELIQGDVIQIVSTENEYLKRYIQHVSKTDMFEIISVNAELNICTIQLSTGTYLNLNQMDIISKMNI